MPNLEQKVIYILSPEAWGVAFVSKHHYAVELANRGNTVFFINPASSQKRKTIVEPISAYKNIFTVTYSPSLRGLNSLPNFLRTVLSRFDAKKIMKACGRKPDIVWSFSPYRFQNLKVFGAPTSIYHPVDIHQAKNLEQVCLKNADIVFVISDAIMKTFGPQPQPMYQINHGLSKHFLEKKQHPEIDFHPNPNSTNVGFVGNLNKWDMDRDTIKQVLLENPNVQFYFIGSYKKSNLASVENESTAYWEDLAKKDNIHLLGPKPSIEVSSYLEKMDLFILCSQTKDDPVRVSNSHKLLEYLSTGKVVVSHYVDQYKEENDLLEMVEDNNDYPHLFKKVVDNLEYYNNDERQQLRKDFAAKNTYEAHIQTIEQLLLKHQL